jgi:2-keto-4-pentenoate hydratase/2-oxohepta-3-ene-1,7-dioic acid hydratase in catechol pathway
MNNLRMGVAVALLGLCVTGFSTPLQAEEAKGTMTKYVRFQVDDKVAYGIVEGERVRELAGDLFGRWKKTDTTHQLDEITILVPSTPTKVIAMAVNYRSHAGESLPPTVPQGFFKVPSCLQRHEGAIELPTENVHYEGELVVVIGKRAKDVEEADALDYVLGVTCGNDVSARDWQSSDTQWWRAKASDTFGPCGPFIVSGLDYDNLNLELRVNGKPLQKTNTNLLIHGVAKIVSFLSKHVTLEPGDLIFTGTPGTTAALHPGDVVEVEIEGVGVLRNRVVSENE